MRLIYCIIALCLLNLNAAAQEESGKKKKSISISNNGITIDTDDSTKKEEKVFDYTVAGVDIGINSLIDNTVYSSAAAQNFLNVPVGAKNESLFSLRTGKSWNVNVWPILFRARLVKGEHQKIYLSSGVGLQMYNFRFTRDISYLNNTQPEVFQDSIQFDKNKLGFTYLSVPLAFTLKTHLGNKIWLVYGAGVTGGYRISSWTKQISSERGKVKNHDAFNFSDFNACLTGEIGIDGIFRIYASYQVTSLHESALDQRPFSIGLRFGGV